MLLVKAFPRIPPISTFSSFMNFRKGESNFSGSRQHSSPALQWKRSQASCEVAQRRSQSAWTLAAPGTPKSEQASPGLWSRRAELSCIPEGGNGWVGMRFGLGSVRTRKHVLNSFKLRIETFTLSSPSSTWILRVKICETLHKRRFTSIWKIELGSRNLRAMSIRRLHVSYKPEKSQQHKERIKD